MSLSRRDFIRHLGIGICAGAAVPFVPSLIKTAINEFELDQPFRGASSSMVVFEDPGVVSLNYSEMLKELYGRELSNLIPSVNPFMTLIAKPEPYDGGYWNEPFELSLG